eukprot:g36735.t1
MSVQIFSEPAGRPGGLVALQARKETIADWEATVYKRGWCHSCESPASGQRGKNIKHIGHCQLASASYKFLSSGKLVIRWGSDIFKGEIGIQQNIPYPFWTESVYPGSDQKEH